MTRARLLGLALVASVALVTILGVAVWATRGAAQTTSAAEADLYNARTPATVAPSLSPQSAGPKVTVVGDDLSAVSSTGAITPWPVLVERALGADVVSLSVTGSGFVRQPTRNAFGGTIGIRANQVAPSSRVVVIEGGANDVGVSTLRLLSAATLSVRAAQAAAPDAQVVLMGPTWTTADPPATVAAVSDTLRRAAKLTNVRFVDPIAGRWLVGVKRPMAPNGVALLPAGQRAVSARMEQILHPLL